MTNASDTVGDPPARAARARPIAWARLAEASALVAATILLALVFGVLEPGSFLSWANLSSMLGSQAVLVVLSLARNGWALYGPGADLDAVEADLDARRERRREQAQSHDDHHTRHGARRIERSRDRRLDP